MNVELKLTTKSEAQIIKNLIPLYLHDISEFDGRHPTDHGLICDDGDLKTIAEQGEAHRGWWSASEIFFPYLIVADGKPAGFNLISRGAGVPKEIEADVIVHEFFITHAFRGTKVGEEAAVQGFDLFRGRWEVVTYPEHERAIGFWRKAIGRYMDGAFTESVGDHVWGKKVIFRFNNGQ